MPNSSTSEGIGFWGLLIIVCLSAIPFGTADTFFRSIVVVCICMIALVRVFHGVRQKSFRFSEPVLFLPLLGILLLALFQSLPLTITGGNPIRSDPYETKVFMVGFAGLLVAAESLFFYTSSRPRLKALIFVVIVIATASSLFGIVRTLMLSDQTSAIEAYFPPVSQGYAQFINRNHFVLLIEMAVGLTFGSLLEGRLATKFKFFGVILFALFIYSAIAANSRGGLISIAALLLFGVSVRIMTRRSSKRAEGGSEKRIFGTGTVLRKVILAFALSSLIFVMFTLAVVLVGGDAVVGRIEKLQTELHTADDNTLNRLAIWRATALLISDQPLFGVGFGGYSTAITRFDNSNGNWKLQQAHNEYLEILAGGGVVAFTLLATFAVIFVKRALQNFKSNDALVRSSCFGSLIGIFGVVVHSIVDFGLHIMINDLVLMVLIVIATTRIDRCASIGSSNIHE